MRSAHVSGGEKWMKVVSETGRRHALNRRELIGAGLALTLAGCNSTAIESPGIGTAAPDARPAPGPAVGETLGSGPIRVGMILPLTQNGTSSPVGVSMRNAAQMAMDEFAAPSLTLMIEDDHSTPDGAAQAAQAEIGAGAALILGPVYAAEVRQAGAVAKAAGKPMVAFSTDASVASPGVYLLSFMIEGYVERIVQFAVSRGKKSFAVMAPQNEYGNIALNQFQETAGRLNTPVAVVARYPSGQPQSAAEQVAAVGGQIDALFIPEQADGMPAVASALASNGIKTQLLGAGVWNDARVLRLPELQGAWFAAPENAGFNALAQRYKAKFGNQPTRLATLSYDAVTLAAALARNGGPDHYGPAAMTNVSGFNGVDGVFRFRPNGTSERGLAVMEIDNSAAVVISPAPRSFAAG
jgi:ABC-type branched-subunit amino acid transport system substrate-binding protein